MNCARETCARACVQAGVLSPHLRRVHGSCYCLDAKLPEKKTTTHASTTKKMYRHELCKKKNTTAMQDCKWNQDIGRLGQQSSFSLMPTVSWGYLERESVYRRSYLLSHYVLSCHPRVCQSCQSWSQVDELHHVRLGDKVEDDDGCWRSECCGSAKVLRPVKT